jgi:DNA-binding CsgD family transcriptional regulator
VASVVSRAQESRAKWTLDLSRLSAAERQALRLLAEGHTVKSIATAIGSTPATVNERLREARRKTGVGSSRELARSLKAQENRYNLIGMGNARRLGAPLSQPDAETWRPQTGVSAMIGLLTLTAAGAAALLTQAQPANELRSNPQMITDPDLGTFAVDGPAWLYPMIRKEARDPNWAAVAERTLRERYATVLFYGTKPQTRRIMCRTRTCEVAVSIPIIKSKSTYGEAEASIVKDMRRKALIQAGAVVSADTKSRRAFYLAYYLRAKR